LRGAADSRAPAQRFQWIIVRPAPPTADWYQALLANSADATALLARDGTVLFVTAPIERLTGFTPQELIGANAFDHVHPDDLPRVRAAFCRAVERTEPVRIEYRARHKDRSWRHRDAIGVNRLADPALAAVVVNYRDISVGSVADAALRERERWTAEQLRAVISSVPIVLWAIDRRGIVTLSEGSLLGGIGLAPGRVVGRSIFDLYANAPGVLDYTRAALRGESPTWMLNLHGRTFSGCYTPLRDASGAIAGAIGVATDVTERVQLEQRLMQTHKMEAIGRLAGSIAHDFNNYLTAIVGYAELGLAQVSAHDPLRQDLAEIRKAGRSAASLTRQLMTFSRKQLLQPQVIDLNAVVSRITGMLRQLIGEDIELRSKLADPLGRVSADPGQIEQVVMNLALNARDAMATGGVLTIETANIELDEKFVADHPGSSAGRHVMLAVSDTGTGIDRDVQERLFEPFYTTKGPGRGTGLGLATVYGIVKQSGGSISVHSEISRGTSFTIFLPRVEQSVDVVAQPPDALGDLKGDETILVVEDQAEVRSVVHNALSRGGYRVLMATSGSEAVDIATQYGGRIDVLITDVVMPGLSARELAERFRHQHPAGRVLYMSGYTSETAVQREVVEQNVDFIEKPFTPATLLRRIRAVLNATVPPDTGG
jgi:two-component system, cell cycle sensor histidine kinase and response regulator CckA